MGRFRRREGDQVIDDEPDVQPPPPPPPPAPKPDEKPDQEKCAPFTWWTWKPTQVRSCVSAHASAHASASASACAKPQEFKIVKEGDQPITKVPRCFYQVVASAKASASASACAKKDGEPVKVVDQDSDVQTGEWKKVTGGDPAVLIQPRPFPVLGGGGNRLERTELIAR